MYNKSQTAFEIHKEALDSSLWFHGIVWGVSVDEEGYVNVNGNVHFNSVSRFNNGIMPFHFRSITGSVEIISNSFTSLIGLPDKIGGKLNIGEGYIKSLKGLPTEVGGDLNIFCDFDITDENIDLVFGCKTPFLHLNKNMRAKIGRYITIKNIINEES